jgi:CHAD domain-containing protein
MSFNIKRIHKAADRMAKFLKKNPKRPGSEAVHDLRTSARSLETTFTTLGLDSKKSVARLLRHLGEVRQRAGKMRVMDVHTANVLTIKVEREQDCLVQLLEHLGVERKKYASKLRRQIKTAGRSLRLELKRTSQRLEKFLEQAGRNSANSDAATKAMARTIQLATELQRPARLGRNNLHPYRLKVKELRNVLRLSNRADDQEIVRQLGIVQDAIGNWHDWEELLAIATKTLDHGPSCSVLKELKAVTTSKYERALASTNQLRAKYLMNKGSKQKRKQTREKSVSTSVLEAASGIV